MCVDQHRPYTVCQLQYDTTTQFTSWACHIYHQWSHAFLYYSCIKVVTAIRLSHMPVSGKVSGSRTFICLFPVVRHCYVHFLLGSCMRHLTTHSTPDHSVQRQVFLESWHVWKRTTQTLFSFFIRWLTANFTESSSASEQLSIIVKYWTMKWHY